MFPAYFHILIQGISIVIIVLCFNPYYLQTGAYYIRYFQWISVYL